MNSSIDFRDHEFFMRRCLQLAAAGAGYVAPNPMVGAVLVHQNRIIGEGYHKHYGEAHAEVNCINNVQPPDRVFIADSVLYVSLEPCAHHGKTPPCADLIIKNKIPVVVVGCRDPFIEVDGKGIEKLKAAGVQIVTGILEKECQDINKRFLTFHVKHRPYIFLKWAETSDGFIAFATIAKDRVNVPFVSASILPKEQERLKISNEYTNRIVHKWRSEEAGILIGTNTALADDPQLTTRLWDGPSPVRMIIDLQLRLPDSLKLFSDGNETIIFNRVQHGKNGARFYYKLDGDDDIIQQLSRALYKLKILSITVEGGAKTLQSFINAKLWDEIMVIKNGALILGEGLSAPRVYDAVQTCSYNISEDVITMFKAAVF